MRLSKPSATKPAVNKSAGPKKKFHAAITHHKGNEATHHVSSHASKDEAQAHYASKYPDAHNITCTQC